MSKPSLPKFWVIIPAAGIGSRMQMDTPKQYLQIDNKTILEHTISRFLGHSVFDKVYVGLSEGDRYFKSLGLEKTLNVDVFTGGCERSETVLNGLNYIADQACAEDWVWVHDAARPCLSSAEIESLIQALEEQNSGLVLGVPVADTLKRVGADDNKKSTLLVSETVSRERLWRAMTPQIFKYGDLYEALNFCHKEGRVVTDEASAIEAFGMQAHIIQGSDQNIKVTVPEDLVKVQNFFKLNAHELNPHMSRKTLKQNDMSYPRIGTGFDVHAFGIGNAITLGGVKIPYERGLVAHSDGDVLLHAIMDAMLGALALGDIGKHFPDTDLEWKGADSRALLRAVNKKIQDRGFMLGNLDSTIIAQAPKMSPFIEQMQINLAEDLGVNMEDVSVKATTTEKLGFTGRKEGIACQASVVLVPYMSGLEK